MGDPYSMPIMRDAKGKEAKRCGSNLTVTGKLMKAGGKIIDDVLDVYSPDHWNVIKGMKIAKKEMQTTDIHCITHLRHMAFENKWYAFEMRQDGTTVFYSNGNQLEKSDDPDSYLHIYEPYKK
jgi:hypothetical protein